jgi:hypothetical protein
MPARVVVAKRESFSKHKQDVCAEQAVTAKANAEMLTATQK